MDVYFLHGLNHRREYPPIIDIVSGLQQQLPGHDIHNLEMAGYEQGNPLLYPVDEMRRRLKNEVSEGCVAVGHSFGGLLLASVALDVYMHTLVLFQPWLRTAAGGAFSELPGPAAALARSAMEGVLLATPDALVPLLPNPDGPKKTPVSKNMDEYRKYMLLDRYPLTFFKQALQLQRSTAGRRLKVGRLVVVISSDESLTDNAAALVFKNRARVVVTPGFHQQVYDDPQQTIEIITEHVDFEASYR